MGLLVYTCASFAPHVLSIQLGLREAAFPSSLKKQMHVFQDATFEEIILEGFSGDACVP